MVSGSPSMAAVAEDGVQFHDSISACPVFIEIEP
jgi:hypothetical protein